MQTVAERHSNPPGPIAQVVRIVRAARAPVIIAILAACFLTIPPQTREVYRALAEERSVWQLLLALPVLCATAFALALMARELLRERAVPRTPRWARKAVPMICGGLIPAALAIGLYLAASDVARIGNPQDVSLLQKMPELRGILNALNTSWAVLLVASLICALVTATLLIPNVGFRALRVRKFFARWRIRIKHMVWFGLACLIFFTNFAVNGSQFLGPISTFLLATISIGAIAALLTRAGDRRQLPILSGVLVGAVLLSLVDWSDNHQIELIESDAPPIRTAADVFKDWYASRKDREYYESRGLPYPVFVVSAAGGGLYAAHHSATVLSRLQDLCPNFSQHIFAISGVSGGTLGSALFANLARKQASNSAHVDCLAKEERNDRRFERQVNTFMDTDFLSPLLGAALFPDTAQRFFPAVTPRFGRARAFESTLTDAWAKLCADEKDNPWSRPFLENWDVGGVAPALIMNSTRVEHGYRVAIAPFEIINIDGGNNVALSNLATFHSLVRPDGSSARRRDISLGTGVSLSARFPWVLPAGRMEARGGPARLVDGGYVENSGLETVFDLVWMLARYYHQGGKHDTDRGSMPVVKLHLIVINDLSQIQGEGSSLGVGEVLSPIRTMLNARETRAVGALTRMWRFIEVCAAYSACGKRVTGGMMPLNLHDFDLPLGWLLAPSTKEIVELQSGDAHWSGTDRGGTGLHDDDKFRRLATFIKGGDDGACGVVRLLQADDTPCDVPNTPVSNAQ